MLVMAPQKIELKVTINCDKCKSEVLNAVTKVSGVDQVSMDNQEGILTVIGEVDPCCVTKQIKKTGKVAKIISVNPVKPPKPPPKTPPPPPPPQPINATINVTDQRPLRCQCQSQCQCPYKPCYLPTCAQCQVIYLNYEPYDSSCSIL